MIPIIQEKRKPSFKEQLLQGLGEVAQSASVGIPKLIGQRRMAEEENEAIQRLTGKSLAGLSPEFKKMFAERLAKTPGHDMIVDALIKKGVPPEDAHLYALLSTGGQTAFIKDLLEAEKRGKKFPSQQEEIPEKPEDIESRISQEIAKQDEGLTPSERVARGKERYATGLKTYQEASTKLRGFSEDKQRLNDLEKLNESKKLPKGLGRINVDLKSGNLRLPFFASPEAQRYVKILNEFSAGAKDTYGSRVTNFDLQQYMQRYPTLLNSEEGRRQILQRMKIVNQINSIYYKNLKKIYDKAGGARKIDSDLAIRYAEELTDPMVEELIKKFDEIGDFPTLPDPVQAKGRTVMNPETGETLRSDGQNWKPIGE